MRVQAHSIFLIKKRKTMMYVQPAWENECSQKSQLEATIFFEKIILVLRVGRAQYMIKLTIYLITYTFIFRQNGTRIWMG